MLLKSWKKLTYVIVGVFLICSCEQETEVEPGENPEKSNLELLFEQGLVTEVTEQLTEVTDDDVSLSNEKFIYKSSVANNINFSDPLSLSSIPNVNSTFIPYPGYVANLWDGSFSQIWFSKGPGTNMLGHSIEGLHYHITWDGWCFDGSGYEIIYGTEGPNGCEPLEEGQRKNRYHEAMFGNEWLASNVKKIGEGRKNFNLYRIRVKGSVPITLYTKDNNDKWHWWPIINPGYWDLGSGALNIKEYHIRASSGDPNDKYSIDDIMIKPL